MPSINQFKLTIIITVYNEEYSILNAIRSLYRNEIYSQTQVILIDDCSTNIITQRLLKLLKKFSNKKIIYSEKNLGLSNSRNIGFEQAESELIIPLDADDYLPPKSLDFIYKSFSDNPHVDFIFGNYIINEKEKSTVVTCDDISSKNYLDVEKLRSNWKLLGTSPCRKSTWQLAGSYSAEYTNSLQDVDFWIRVIKNGGIGLYIDFTIYVWNRTILGMNSTFPKYHYYKLIEEHRDFYIGQGTADTHDNAIFKGYYETRQFVDLLNFANNFFLHLSHSNRVAFLNIILKNEWPGLNKKQIQEFLDDRDQQKAILIFYNNYFTHLSYLTKLTIILNLIRHKMTFIYSFKYTLLLFK